LEEYVSFATIKAFVTSDNQTPDLATIEAMDMTLRQIEDRDFPTESESAVGTLKAQGNAFFGAKVGYPFANRLLISNNSIAMSA
jgi:hypothetical protein